MHKNKSAGQRNAWRKGALACKGEKKEHMHGPFIVRDRFPSDRAAVMGKNDPFTQRDIDAMNRWADREE